MDMLSSCGLVPLQDYLKLESTELYKNMETYSDRFLHEQQARLRSYSRSWVRDPFHQWSRRWEYPWVAHQLSSLPAGGRKILDAGSGLTFFPFYLNQLNPAWEIHCLDSDARLVKPYADMDKARFTNGVLQKIPFADGAFDALYCISVLEHTNNYEEIVRELHRVLKPGGLAMITFDVCLNRIADIPPEKAVELILILKKYFRVEAGSPEFGRPDLLRTEWIRTHLPDALPWRFPRLSALKAGLRSRRLPAFIDLTIFTVRAQK